MALFGNVGKRGTGVRVRLGVRGEGKVQVKQRGVEWNS